MYHARFLVASCTSFSVSRCYSDTIQRTKAENVTTLFPLQKESLILDSTCSKTCHWVLLFPVPAGGALVHWYTMENAVFELLFRQTKFEWILYICSCQGTTSLKPAQPPSPSDQIPFSPEFTVFLFLTCMGDDQKKNMGHKFPILLSDVWSVDVKSWLMNYLKQQAVCRLFPFPISSFFLFCLLWCEDNVEKLQS